MRALTVPIMAIIFLGWVFYITFITKTLKKNKNEVFAGFAFIAIWVVILVVI
ncbi:hypothetical protein [Mucilaginibacter gilvus]|uniref:hypothetical protein n=1 Tax=Mucilaginibacter gilvus TaxID=2305909 RepID=UPI00141A47D9|nr:hypothetical protein [Mucilaginibacter gilvus]